MGGFGNMLMKVAVPTRVDSPVDPVTRAVAPKAAEQVDKLTPTALLTRRLPQSTANSPGVQMLATPGKALGQTG